MNPNTTNRLLRLLLGAALLLGATGAYAQGETVTIKSVDNYAGNSNVYTDKPNTTVKVTEMDADKKPVRSWTGTTDSDGKITIPAGSNLSKPYLRAVIADPKSAEFYLPTEVLANEPFLFSSSGTLKGEVFTVKTVEGEVVATAQADEDGRMFLERGLATGAYLALVGDGRNNKICAIKIPPKIYDYSAQSNRILTLHNDFLPVDFSKLGVLEGNFPNPNQVVFDDFISTRSLNVRAATPRQIVFDRPGDVGADLGPQQITVRDRTTGQTATTELFVYSASAKLTQVKVPSGAETHLLVMVTPKIMEGEVTASVLGGPMRFEGGGNEMSLPLTDGQADFTLQSIPGGLGEFNVAWFCKPEADKKKYKWYLWEPKKTTYKAFLWRPPTIATDLPNGPTKKDEPEKKPEQRGGGTVAQPDDGWVKFVDEDGRTGRKKITDDNEGYRREVKVYDDGGTQITTTRTGQQRKTEKVETTTGKPGDKTEVVEELEYKKDEKGEWVPEKGTKKTWKDNGKEKVLEKTETWDKKKKGWR